MFAKKALLSQYIFTVDGYEAIDPNSTGRGEYHLILKIKDGKIPDAILEDTFLDVKGKKVSVMVLYEKRPEEPRIEYYLGEMRGWAAWEKISNAETDKKYGAQREHYFIIPEGKKEALSLCRRWKIKDPLITSLSDDGSDHCRECEEILYRMKAKAAKVKKKETEQT